MLKNSATLIEEMFQRFAVKHAAQFPGEPKLTKRQASRWLSETDFHVLARWTNGKAHATRRDWRVPLARVAHVCRALDATSDELDELMVARLSELLAHDKSEDIPALLQWLQPMLEEFARRPVVGALERQVLAAFSRAYDATEVAHHCPTPFELDDELEDGLKGWLGRAVSAHVDQLNAEAEAEELETPRAAARVDLQARVTAKLRAQSLGKRAATVAQPQIATRKEYDRKRKALVRDFARDLRQQARAL